MEYPEFTEEGSFCPCGAELVAQWDTTDDEPCWECPDCGAWYTVGGDPAFDGTSVPLEQPPPGRRETRGARWTRCVF